MIGGCITLWSSEVQVEFPLIAELYLFTGGKSIRPKDVPRTGASSTTVDAWATAYLSGLCFGSWLIFSLLTS
jgi:hypothetical protein